jgi:NADH-quinone oxidoreductase subunit N
VLVALGAFGVILLAGRKGFEADKLDHYKGLYQRDPLLALVMMVLMFSFAGVPPFVGFWAKLRIIQALWETSHLGLVVVAVVMSVVGAFYYLRVVKLMYFDKAEDTNALQGGGAMRFVLSINGLAMLYLGLMPGSLMDWCLRTIKLTLAS